MVHHNVIVMHFRRDVIGNIDCERYRDLGLKFLINVAVRDPNHFSIGVVVSRQYVRNVHDLAALIYQFAAQHFFAESVGLQLLLVDLNHRIGARGHQHGFRVHANALYLIQPDPREIDPIRRYLLRQQNV